MRLSIKLIIGFLMIFLCVCARDQQDVLLKVDKLTLDKEAFLALYPRSSEYRQKRQFTSDDLITYIDRNILPEMLFAAEGYARNLDKTSEVESLLAEEKKRLLTEPNGFLYKSVVPESITVSITKLRDLHAQQNIQVKFAHIWVHSKILADSLYNLIANGADFSELARLYSAEVSTSFAGGIRDQFYSRGMFPEQIEEVLYNLEIGETSQPIELLFGLHIVKLLDKKEVKVPPIEQMADGLRRRITVLENNRIMESFIHELVEKNKLQVDKTLVPIVVNMYSYNIEKNIRQLDTTKTGYLDLSQTLVTWIGGEWTGKDLVKIYNEATWRNQSPLFRVEDVLAFARNALISELMFQDALEKRLDKTEKFNEFFENFSNEIVSRECQKQLMSELMQVKEIEIRSEYEENEQYNNQEYTAVKKEIEDSLLRKKSADFAYTAMNMLREKHRIKYNQALIAEIAQDLEKIL